MAADTPGSGPAEAGQSPAHSPGPAGAAPQAPAFEIEASPSAGVKALRLAILGLGAVGFALAAWLARGRDDGWILLGLGALMLWAGWRHGRLGLSWGTLRVDAQGRPGWRPVESDGFLPVRVERWHAGEKLAWLRLRTPDGRRHEVLFGRGAVDEESWRRLASWLAWLRRGTQAS